MKMNKINSSLVPFHVVSPLQHNAIRFYASTNIAFTSRSKTSTATFAQLGLLSHSRPRGLQHQNQLSQRRRTAQPCTTYRTMTRLAVKLQQTLAGEAIATFDRQPPRRRNYCEHFHPYGIMYNESTLRSRAPTEDWHSLGPTSGTAGHCRTAHGRPLKSVGGAVSAV